MLKSYKFPVIIWCLCFFSAWAQNDANYKDVLLDGKPAKLNLVTGEITFKDSLNNKTVDSLKLSASNLESVNTNANFIETDSIIDVKPKFHIVKQGERLLDISKTYDMSLTKLKELNALETTLIDENQVLRIREFDDDSMRDKIQSTIFTYHTVSKGETLYALSRLYDIKTEDLKRINNLNSDIIKIGQKLSVDKNTIANFESPKIYTVSKGDNLYRIARKNNTTVNDLKRLNNLSTDLIKVGQKLKLK